MAFGVAMKFNSLPKEGEPLNIIMRPPLEGEEAIVSAGISKGKVNEFTNTNQSVTIEMEHEFFASHAKEANSAFWIIAIGNDDADDIGRPIGVFMPTLGLDFGPSTVPLPTPTLVATKPYWELATQ